MKIEIHENLIHATGPAELGGSEAAHFEGAVCAALPPNPRAIEVDLSGTASVDSAGVGALVAVYAEAARRQGDVTLRMLNPRPPVRQFLELTRMHRLFEIQPAAEPPSGPSPR